MTLFENMSPLRFLNAKNDDESVNDFIKTLGTKTKWQVFFSFTYYFGGPIHDKMDFVIFYLFSVISVPNSRNFTAHLVVF